MSEGQLRFYEKLALEGRGFLADEPEVPREGGEAWEAFWALSSSRSVGMGVGGIPFLAIDRYAERYGVEDFPTFHRLIQALDGAYMEHTNTRGD